MRIVITKTFEKDFIKVLKYRNFLNDFSDLLKKKSHTFIDLKDPYKKFKYKIWNISLRSILFFSFENKIIPIFIAKKSDKKDWYNIILDNRFNDILKQKLLLVKDDIQKWNFEIY